MRNLILLKTGALIKILYSLLEFNLTQREYNSIVNTINAVLKDIKPVRPKLEPDIKEFIEQTNRRLNNG